MIKRIKETYQTFQIVPDRLIKNDNLEIFTNALWETYQPFLARVGRHGDKGYAYRPQDWHWWEIRYELGKVGFYLSVKPRWASYAKEKLELVWPKVTAKEVDGKIDLAASCTDVASLKLKYHFFLSLAIAKNNLHPLHALLGAVKHLEGDDRAIVQVGFCPVGDDWQYVANQAHADFTKGGMPLRPGVDAERASRFFGRMALGLVVEVVNLAGEMLDSKWEREKIEDSDRQALLRKGPLSVATRQKTQLRGFEVAIRVGVESRQQKRRAVILKAIATAFNNVAADNELVMQKGNGKLAQAIVERRGHFFGQGNILSTAELAKFLQLPTVTLQDQFREVDCKTYRETSVPEHITKGGLLIGEAQLKTKKYPIHFPTDNIDELCQPRIVIGEQGSGKSTFGANFAIEAFEAGYTIFAIDVADGQMTNQIRDSLPVGSEAQIVELDFGNIDRPIALNWCEVAEHSKRAASRLSAELVNFFDRYSEESGGRTRRWLKKAGAAVLDNPAATMLEVLLMLLSKDYREQIMPTIDSIQVRAAWEGFDRQTERAQDQIVGPILNRIDYLLDDDYLKNILCQRPKTDAKGSPLINFRTWMDAPKPMAILCKVPKSVLGGDTTDALVTFLIAKIWLATLTRADLDIKGRRPTFLIMDEPHQFLSSASHWEQMVVESRKWRLGLVWLFHSWAQLPKQLREIIKAAGPHYCLYASSRETYEELEREIAPFTIEEALTTPRFSALIRMRAKGQIVPTFLARMMPPTPVVERRTKKSEECGIIFGRDVKEVEEDIYQREKIIFEG